MTESREQKNKQELANGEAIISGIEADARTEEQQIIKDAQDQVAEKKKYAEKKIESILEDAQKEAQNQAESAKKKILSGMQIELKRHSLNIRSEVIKDILKRVENKFNSMIDKPDYRHFLIEWIAEAAIGLDSDSATINASQKELPLIDEKLISEALEEIKTKTDKQIALQLSDEPALKNQGVVLTSSDGRTAYNNQIKTRISRKERDIRMAIYNTLFTNDRKEEE